MFHHLIDPVAVSLSLAAGSFSIRCLSGHRSGAPQSSYMGFSTGYSFHWPRAPATVVP
jgi:hypothetical protein